MEEWDAAGGVRDRCYTSNVTPSYASHFALIQENGLTTGAWLTNDSIHKFCRKSEIRHTNVWRISNRWPIWSKTAWGNQALIRVNFHSLFLLCDMCCMRCSNPSLIFDTMSFSTDSWTVNERYCYWEWVLLLFSQQLTWDQYRTNKHTLLIMLLEMWN